MKKIIISLCAILFLFTLVGCGGSSTGDVYLLNFKPEKDTIFKSIAEAYTKETGVNVKVYTAASGNYESTLRSEMLKSKKPTIFYINGPVGFSSWDDYTLKLNNTAEDGYNELLLYDALLDKNLAISADNNVYAIPITLEGYGWVYNKTVFDEYFMQPDKASSLTSLDSVSSFDEMKIIVEDLTKYINGTKNKTNAPSISGLSGVFASTSLKEGSQWPYQTHLANIPFYYEFIEANEDATLGGLSLKEITFKYNNEYKNTFDLYTNNSITPKAQLGDKAYDDSVAEFATGRVAIIQQGNWVYSNIKDVSGNKIMAENIKMMPIFTGHPGEENKNIAVGTENYWCINSQVSKEEINASIDFANWLFAGNGKKYVSEDLGFIAPYDTFSDSEKPTDPLALEVLRNLELDKETIPWSFQAFPSEKFKNDFGGALLEYVQGKKSWEDVVNIVNSSWKKEAE